MQQALHRIGQWSVLCLVAVVVVVVVVFFGFFIGSGIAILACTQNILTNVKEKPGLGLCIVWL